MHLTEKVMNPLGMVDLARWLEAGLSGSGPVLGLPREAVREPGSLLRSQFQGQWLAAPLGVAAGPHSQLAQNIVASFLCGARFIELKTVQHNDAISVSRPCIDSVAETYNCEWSQELSLEQSLMEYVHAWVLVHWLTRRLGFREVGTIFAASIGYDLAGMQGPKMQRFISGIRNAAGLIEAAVEQLSRVDPSARELRIPHEVAPVVTLSTMHGCPPSEIERIAAYLLEEQGWHTWVKLNPTLLGPEELRGILHDSMGHRVTVPDGAFEHDPVFADGVTLIENLARRAKAAGRHFGVKLSNTLEVVNHRKVFPAHERSMYLSGAALHPLTVRLAHRLRAALSVAVPMSFCGGADATNYPRLVACGLGPVTTCTDLLKPGGYARLGQYLDNLEAEIGPATSLSDFVGGGAMQRSRLSSYAETVIRDRRYAARPRPPVPKGGRTLGRFDCIAAPCQEGCPAGQDVADYMHLVATGQASEALSVIRDTNPLAAVTARVCDHPCVDRCVRSHYEGPLAIREIKRFAVEMGLDALPVPAARALPSPARVAIIGAGPMGLSAAHYLRLAGADVTVFDGREQAGGMASRVIPTYRLKDDEVLVDVERVAMLGAKLELGRWLTKDWGVRALLDEGYTHVVLATGARRGKRLGIPGEDGEGVWEALEFLDRIRSGERLDVGERVVVIGGGNSAMDAARTAWRTAGEVTVVYRRTRAEMPADHEEIAACLEEGVPIRDLLAPLSIVRDGGTLRALRCQRMKLGDVGADGRPRPVAIEGSEVEIACDTVVLGIGQDTALEFLDGLPIDRNQDGTLVVDAHGQTTMPGVYAGGDVVRGPATVIKATADGRTIAEAIVRERGGELLTRPALVKGKDAARLLEERGKRKVPVFAAHLPLDERKSFKGVIRSLGPLEAQAEASRCLDCDELCSLCVTVCPNRANFAFEIGVGRVEAPRLRILADGIERAATDGLKLLQRTQVAHIRDLCNECGNCTTFCPTSGAPFRDKWRIYLDRDQFNQADEAHALHVESGTDGTVVTARCGTFAFRPHETVCTLPSAIVTWDLEGRVRACVPTPDAVVGEEIDLRMAAEVVILRAALPHVPTRTRANP